MQLGLSENFNQFNHCHQTDISESIVSCNYNRVHQLLDWGIHVFSASVFHILCGFHRFTLAGKTHEPRTTSPTRGRSVPPRWLSVWPVLVVVIRSRFRTVAAKPGNSDKGILAKWKKRERFRSTKAPTCIIKSNTMDDFESRKKMRQRHVAS